MDKNPYLPGSPDEFIERNMGLARFVAWKYAKARKDRDYEEILSVANYALIKAYIGFNPGDRLGQDGKGIKFATYATRTIHGFIMTHLRLDRPIHLGRRVIDLIAKINSAGLTGNETIEEIAIKAGISIDEANEAVMASIAVNVDSMDREINADDGNITLGDMLGKCDEVNEDKEVLNDFIKGLDHRLQEIYRLRMVEEKSQPEAAKEMRISQSYLSRLETRLMKAAREFGQRKEGEEMANKYPDSFKYRIKELAITSTNTAGEIQNILKSEFPEIQIPYTSLTSMISVHRRNTNEEPEVITRKVTLEEAQKYGIKTSFDDTEWFEDITVPTISSIGIARSGVSFNATALQEMQLKAGENVRVGLNPDGRLFVGKHTQGMKLKGKNPGNGAVVVNKNLVEWLEKKGVEFKRYPIRYDEQVGMFYVKVG